MYTDESPCCYSLFSQSFLLTTNHSTHKHEFITHTRMLFITSRTYAAFSLISSFRFRGIPPEDSAHLGGEVERQREREREREKKNATQLLHQTKFSRVLIPYHRAPPGPSLPIFSSISLHSYSLLALMRHSSQDQTSYNNFMYSASRYRIYASP